MRARARAGAGARATAAAAGGAPACLFACAGTRCPGWAGSVDFDFSAVLSKREGGIGWTRMLYSWAEGVREPTVKVLGRQLPAGT